jgi:pyruvate formate lyase activating enzyme
MKALIFDIKRFAIHDGPGIRTTVFFKGCPLICHWCHNPESRTSTVEPYLQNERVGNKTFKVEKEIGKYYSVEALLDEVKRDQVFYRETNGGVTCSGGEPLDQAKFLELFLEQCRKYKIPTALDTSGYADLRIVERISHLIDLFLFDIKHLDNTIHKKFTGVYNDVILENFDWIVNSGHDVIARIPIITGINADPGYISSLINYLNERKCNNFDEVHLLPYHHIGCAKYSKFNIKSNDGFKEPSRDILEGFADQCREKGFKTKIGG